MRAGASPRPERSRVPIPASLQGRIRQTGDKTRRYARRRPPANRDPPPHRPPRRHIRGPARPRSPHAQRQRRSGETITPLPSAPARAESRLLWKAPATSAAQYDSGTRPANRETPVGLQRWRLPWPQSALGKDHPHPPLFGGRPWAENSNRSPFGFWAFVQTSWTAAA